MPTRFSASMRATSDGLCFHLSIKRTSDLHLNVYPGQTNPRPPHIPSFIHRNFPRISKFRVAPRVIQSENPWLIFQRYGTLGGIFCSDRIWCNRVVGPAESTQGCNSGHRKGDKRAGDLVEVQIRVFGVRVFTDRPELKHLDKKIR